MACVACGHDWIEGPPLPVPDLRRNEPLTQDTVASQEPDDRAALLAAARSARKEFERMQRLRRVRMAAWYGLMLIGLSPVATATAFPEAVVAVFPATAHFYERLGTNVNIYGLEIGQVDVQHLIVGGREVIAVKGQVANISMTERKIPWLRFGLSNQEGSEVYHWTLDTEARPLMPGESTRFVTRLASPPEAARNLQIRFARADEIGSNTGP